jgi:hypothetical protein
MSSKTAKESVLTSKERKKLLKQAVPMKPDAPNNLHISKAQFIANRQKENEEAMYVEKARLEFRAKKQEESDGVQKGEEEKKVEVKNKGGRPKRIED